jgi:RimJ/RimL family protein N-acetyltransferase
VIRQGKLASRRVAEKVGMRLDAEITRYGQPYWVYALSRDELAQPP